MNNLREQSRGKQPRVNTKSSDKIKSAAKRHHKATRRFWRDYFAKFPDYEGNAQMNRLREHFSEVGR